MLPILLSNILNAFKFMMIYRNEGKDETSKKRKLGKLENFPYLDRR